VHKEILTRQQDWRLRSYRKHTKEVVAQLGIWNSESVLSKLAVIAHARAAFCLANLDAWTSAHATPPGCCPN
jgi:hypothetical protein